MTDPSFRSSPQHAVALELGRLAIALSFFDRNLALAYAKLTGEGAVAWDVLQNTRTTSGQIKLFRGAIAVLPGSPIDHPLTQVFDVRQSVAERRNHLMHDVWTVSRSGYGLLPERMSASYPDGFAPTPVNATDLSEMTVSIQAASHALLDWLTEPGSTD